jgi:hypothetical protein
MLRAGETMKVLHTFDIPEDDALLASWTEAKIAGVHLGELVAELEVLREADHTAAVPKHDGRGLEPTVKLEEVLGNRLPDICARGLAAVPAQIIRRLFREPSLLIDLQERVLTEGGPYWDKKLRESDELKKRTEAGWARLAATLPAKPSVRLAPKALLRVRRGVLAGSSPVSPLPLPWLSSASGRGIGCRAIYKWPKQTAVGIGPMRFRTVSRGSNTSRPWLTRSRNVARSVPTIPRRWRSKPVALG